VIMGRQVRVVHNLARQAYLYHDDTEAGGSKNTISISLVSLETDI
jgi:hypothetical protein